jgi:uncharacterized protein YndB with AHSA1/START domain
MADREPSNEIHLTRVYEAPVDLVWEAWTDPAQVEQWWGPRGFTLTTHSKGLRPGGIWHYTMHGPDGTDYPNMTVYHEVQQCQKLVYDHGAYKDRPPMFRVTVRFTATGSDQTTMHMIMALPTAEEAEATRRFIKLAGGNATWDRLAEYLARQKTGKEQFVISRSFAAPLEQMFAMWTTPEHIVRWLPPTGFRMEFLRADLRQGGSTLFEMSNEAGVSLHARCEYQTIQPPRRVVYTQQFCDEQENIVRHPMAPTWPATLLTTVVLAAEGPDRTRVTVTSEALGDVTAEELQAFMAERPGMTLGWTGSFDKLEDLLSVYHRPA